MAAGILYVVAFLPYVVSILHGKTKPSRMTWMIWSLLNVITLSSYFRCGVFSVVPNAARRCTVRRVQGRLARNTSTTIAVRKIATSVSRRRMPMGSSGNG